MYKTRILFTGIFLFTLPLFGQVDFGKIDESIKSAPDSFKTYQEIATWLSHDLHTDTEKARAIYIWIAQNIRCDLSQANSGKRAAPIEMPGLISFVFKK